uniref:RING-type domain-containing protein n=1 Tax=Steinernema glaseri TaxID=37863 RepID=A0A1I8ACJ2_9BILA
MPNPPHTRSSVISIPRSVLLFLAMTSDGVAAASSSGSLCRINPDSVKCPICHEIFERPVQLGCGHVVCRECHERLVEVSAGRTREGLTVVRCPECRADSTVPRTGAVECFALKGVIEQFKNQVSLAGDCLDSLVENPILFTCSMCLEKVKTEKAFVCLSCERSNLICASCGILYHGEHKVGRAQLATEEDRRCAFQELRSHKRQCETELFEHRKHACDVENQIKNLTLSLENELKQKFDSYGLLLERDVILRARYNGIRHQIENRTTAFKNAIQQTNHLLTQISAALNNNSVEMTKIFRNLDSQDSTMPVQMVAPNADDANFTRNGPASDGPTTPGRRKKVAIRRTPQSDSKREVPTPPEDLPTPNEEDLVT